MMKYRPDATTDEKFIRYLSARNIVVAIAIIGLMLATLEVLAGCATTKRGDIIDVKDIPSPDGRYVCTVFGETFYDTTGYLRHIYLRRAGEECRYPGNVYIVHIGDDVTVSWDSPGHMSVILSFETRHALPAATNVAGVSVTFSEKTR